jgi:hypothetical protein
MPIGFTGIPIRLCRPRDMGFFLDACILMICGVPRVAGTEVFSFSGVAPETLPSFLALSDQSLVSCLCQQKPWNSSGPFGTSLEQNPQFMGRFSAISGVKAIESSGVMERAMGIEQIRMNQTKALPPVPQFNWSQMASSYAKSYDSPVARVKIGKEHLDRPLSRFGAGTTRYRQT